RRERIMKRFKSQRHLQRFVSIHDPIANLFQIPRHDISSGYHRELRTAAMSLRGQIFTSLDNICGWRLSLAFHPLSLRCLRAACYG
ncbi:hypothetical protein ACC754_36055, partial [Rhizobium johnstonii]